MYILKLTLWQRLRGSGGYGTLQQLHLRPERLGEYSEGIQRYLWLSYSGDELYGGLFRKALEGDKDCGGLVACNYISGEPVAGFAEGRPLFVRRQDGRFNLANFIRTHLYAAFGTLKIGNDLLFDKEGVKVDVIWGHGGIFKTEGTAQKILAAALNTPVSVMKSAGEGGAWGIAVLALYMINKKEGEDFRGLSGKTDFSKGRERNSSSGTGRYRGL